MMFMKWKIRKKCACLVPFIGKTPMSVSFNGKDLTLMLMAVNPDDLGCHHHRHHDLSGQGYHHHLCQLSRSGNNYN